jgi:hypothetical protein
MELLGILGVLLWPPLSESSRTRRLRILAALTGNETLEGAGPKPPGNFFMSQLISF